MTAATSASDRYDEARAILARYDAIESDDDPGYHDRVDAAIDAVGALRALVNAPEVAETPERAAMRVYMGIHSFPWLVRGDAMRDLIQRGYLAGIQAAWESWEPENAPGMVDTRATDVLDVVFDRIPDAEGANFIEVEDARGASVKVGEWHERPDGYAALRLEVVR